MPVWQAAARILCKLQYGFFDSPCEIFLTLAAGTRIRVAAVRTAIRALSSPEQQTIERRKEILHGKESQEGRQESTKEGQVTRSRFRILFCKGAAANRGAFFCR
jgi:hypothetical protein